MRHKRKKLLMDISIACREIISFTEDKSYEIFLNDRLLQFTINN